MYNVIIFAFWDIRRNFTRQILQWIIKSFWSTIFNVFLVSPIFQFDFSFYLFVKSRRVLVIKCYYLIWNQICKNIHWCRVEKVNLLIYQQIGEGSLPVKLADGFIYSINIGFCIIPEMEFIRWRVFNSKPGLSKGNLVLTVFMKIRMCSSIDNKVWLIFENQVNAKGAIFTNIWVGSSINYWTP